MRRALTGMALCCAPLPARTEGTRMALHRDMGLARGDADCAAAPVDLAIAPLTRGVDGGERARITLGARDAVALATSARGPWTWQDQTLTAALVATVGDALILPETDRQAGAVVIHDLCCEEKYRWIH